MFALAYVCHVTHYYTQHAHYLVGGGDVGQTSGGGVVSQAR